MHSERNPRSLEAGLASELEIESRIPCERDPPMGRFLAALLQGASKAPSTREES
jgi:hypothetical protein